MAKSIKVTIGGKEYALVGDDEHLIRSTASELNRQMDEIASSHGDLPDKTVAILAALNIAEEQYKANQQLENLSTVLVSEINKMSYFLKQNLNNT